ncbi:Metallo-dependent phosphatase [Guyanagaster necrorhizus]|uniref:Metallo-dependent phosphatase n=1 Tax=Guyanagaster necrorhizus TaxID=856835 RepID=A0A9P7W5B2_9AGAR|nr:Metallo-dependent phosphatase [Guyanagaster necrorhizus MCA 3950]KAG7452859.1 Metallo-dependent phosphatase [Guyanagaster necrorhizus MCA 3950]
MIAHSGTILSTDSACVYLLPGYIPPKPGDDWTRFVCISDTHSNEYPLPDGDILLHAGDLTMWGTIRELHSAMNWLNSQPHPTKICIAGNHDMALDPYLDTISVKEYNELKEYVKRDEFQNGRLHYLEYESLTVRTSIGKEWKVFGSPGSLVYKGAGGFQYRGSRQGQEICRKIPLDTEVLLSHTPPYKIHDTTRRGKSAGCEELTERMNVLEKCRLHVFGHIHEACGASINDGGRVSVNAAMRRKPSATIVDLRNW